MSMAFGKIAGAALELPIRSRAKLAEKLLKSLDGLSELEIEKLWASEAEKRYLDYKKGKTKSIDGDQFMEKLKNRHK